MATSSTLSATPSVLYRSFIARLGHHDTAVRRVLENVRRCACRSRGAVLHDGHCIQRDHTGERPAQRQRARRAGAKAVKEASANAHSARYTGAARSSNIVTLLSVDRGNRPEASALGGASASRTRRYLCHRTWQGPRQAVHSCTVTRRGQLTPAVAVQSSTIELLAVIWSIPFINCRIKDGCAF